MSKTTQQPKIQSIPQKPKVESIPQPESQSAKYTNEIYSVFQQSIDKYFKEVRSNAATYLQSVSNLQQEIVELMNNNV